METLVICWQISKPKEGKMKIRKVYSFLVVSLLLVILSFAYVNKPTTLAANDNALRLEAPRFVNVARADSSDLDIGSYLDDEAGISAWYQSPDAINLSQVRDQFRTIETETADYIIGSVPVPGYRETADPHVYVHRDGWILAYYMRSDTIGKIVDAGASSITTTKLKNVVAAMAGAADAPFTDATYYDFRYPNATHMMLIAESYSNGNDFTVQLPSTYGYFERGWAINDFGGGVWYFRLDGVNLSSTGSDMSNVAYGSITAAQLLPDVTHTVSVDDWGAMVILYRVP
jgi:hypothetical protein